MFASCQLLAKFILEGGLEGGDAPAGGGGGQSRPKSVPLKENPPKFAATGPWVCCNNDPQLDRRKRVERSFE